MWRKAADVSFWLGTSLYFGGLITLGAIVAPAVFATASDSHLSMPGIAAPPLAMGPQVGGEIFGEILNRFLWIQIISLALSLAGIAAWIFSHRTVRRSTWILLILWVMLAALTAYDAGYLRPKVFDLRTTIRSKAQGTPATSTTDWPEQKEFDALHVRSESLGHWESYILIAMVLVASWRGLAEGRPARNVPVP